MPVQDAAVVTVSDSPSTNGGPDRRPLIDGEMVVTDRVFASVNPATGAVIGHAPDAGIEEAQRALAVARRIRAGSFSINGGNYFSTDAPFGGFKHSGVGRDPGVA